MADFEESTEAYHRTIHPDAQWFPHAGFGLFMHWGIHSVAGIQPSWAMIKDYPAGGDPAFHPPEKYYALAEQFNPQRYDPDKWMAAAKRAGFTYAVLTTKHHDGYTLWPSDYGDMGTYRYLDGQDLLKPYVETCRKHGLKVGFYFSFADWNHPLCPVGDVGFDYNKRAQFPPIEPEEDRRRFDAFYEFTMGQIEELLTRYGKIDLLWFDGVGWRDRKDLRAKETIDRIRKFQPGIVINNRWGRIGDYVTPECHFPEERPEGWWETCQCTNGHWGYNPGKPLPSAEWFLSLLAKCRAWGGNLLANIGPAPDGTMPEDFYPLCDVLAEWMAKNRGSLDGAEGSQP